ncbi:hypothetical protein [Halorubellus sp. PRR65]|nr:hypothetical protein [Halorubellus sp. PRR65]
MLEGEPFQAYGSEYTLRGSSDYFFILSLGFSDGPTKLYVTPVSK